MNKNNTYIMLSDGKFLEDEVCYEGVKHIIKPQSRVVCIPFACSPVYLFKECNRALSYNGDFFNQHYNHFIEYGIDRDDFYVVNPSDPIEFVKWKLEYCDIIYLSGGSMKVLKFMLQSFGLWDILRKIEDKVIIGESAGTLVLQDTYTVFRDELPFKRNGLELIDNVDVFVHYNKEEHEDMYREFKRFLDCTMKQGYIYALPDNGGLIVEGNKVTKVGIVYE